VLVIGVGNEFRRDDGVGLVVARRIAQECPEITVIEQSGEGAALMETWQNDETVFLIDAVSSGAAPGTIHRLDAHEQEIPAQFFSYSTHAFSVAEAIELARVLNNLPSRLIVYGVEGQDFASGLGLSTATEQAAQKVTQRILEEINSPNYRPPNHRS
jgi:hydrogenase maturation protease